MHPVSPFLHCTAASVGIGFPYIGIKSDFIVVLIVPSGALAIGFFESNIIIFAFDFLSAFGCTYSYSSKVGSVLALSRPSINSDKSFLELLFF